MLSAPSQGTGFPEPAARPQGLLPRLGCRGASWLDASPSVVGLPPSPGPSTIYFPRPLVSGEALSKARVPDQVLSTCVSGGEGIPTLCGWWGVLKAVGPPFPAGLAFPEYVCVSTPNLTASSCVRKAKYKYSVMGSDLLSLTAAYPDQSRGSLVEHRGAREQSGAVRWHWGPGQEAVAGGPWAVLGVSLITWTAD